MKKTILILMVFFVALNSFSQNSNEKKSTSKIKVVYKDQVKQHTTKPVAYFVNGNFRGGKLLYNPNSIKSVRTEKETLEKNGKTYFGKILIITKQDYHPDFVSLKELLSELVLDQSQTLIQIDENVINRDYNDYFVDKIFILKIEISKSKTTGINLVKIISKTKKNIKKANEILIRGNQI